MRLKHRLLLSMLCLTIAAPVAFGQATTMTREDQVNLVAPTSSGETGLFTAVTGNQLRAGDWSFGVYLNDYDLFAGPARSFAPLTARKYQDLGYDLYRTDVSLGYGITDRWEVSAALPWDRIQGHGGDRAGFINGWLYQGRFSDSGVGNLHLATKIGLMAPDAPSKLALSIFADLPTGDKNSGISSGNGNFGAGLHSDARDRHSRRYVRHCRQARQLALERWNDFVQYVERRPAERAPVRRRSEHSADVLAHDELDQRSQRHLVQRRRLQAESPMSS